MRGTITVKIHNIDQSQPMIFADVDNTYIKEGFFCIIRRNRNEVQKFPVNRIFRIIEPYLPEDYVSMPEPEKIIRQQLYGLDGSKIEKGE